MSEGFVCYKSFIKAIKKLPPEDFKECMLVLANYALDGEEPEEMSPYVEMFFEMARPQIDANAKKREAGSVGGKANRKQNEAESKQNEAESKQNEAESKQNEAKEKVKEKVKEKEKVKAKAKENGGTPYPLSTTPGLVEDIEAEQIAELGVDIYAAESLSNWIKSRSEKREPITESEFKALVSTVQSSIQKHGVTAVRNQIQESMANGYKGLCLDRLDQKPRNRAAPDKTNVLDGLTDSASKFLARGNG